MRWIVTAVALAALFGCGIESTERDLSSRVDPLEGGRASRWTASPVRTVQTRLGLELTFEFQGTFETGAADWAYVPLLVLPGVSEIEVHYSYDKPATPAGVAGNALDIGIFDESGTGLANEAGFRGWSGGFRDTFTINRTEATPGYLAGRIGPGLWHLVLGPYTVAPQGLNWTAKATLRFGPSGAAPAPTPLLSQAVNNVAGWYRGDLHLHTVHSDGSYLPSEIVAGAVAGGLSFIVSTDHNTSSSHRVWSTLARPDLLVIPGEEVTTRGGHYLAAGLKPGHWIDWRYRPEDNALPRFLDAIHRDNGIAIAAHPYCPWVGCSWRFGYDGMDGIEIWNGPWTLDDEASLKDWSDLLGKGRFVAAVGNSDAHRSPNVIGLPQTVVRAAKLERGAVLDAVKRGHSYLAASKDISLSLSAVGPSGWAEIGETLTVSPKDTVRVIAHVSGAPNASVSLITQAGSVETLVLDSAGTRTFGWNRAAGELSHVRIEVRDPANASAMLALSNPIFFRSPAQAQ
ncbi:MAG: CehA/McbA family metallohydrolase [Myxococcaceae bacterium]